MAVGNPFARSQGFNYISDNKYLQDDFTGSTPLDFSNISSSGIMSQAPYIYPPVNQGGGDGGGGGDDDDDDDENPTNAGITGKMDIAKNVLGFMVNPIAFGLTKAYQAYRNNQKQKADAIADANYKAQRERDFKEMAANPNNPDGSTAAYNYAGRDNEHGTHTSTMSNEQAQSNQDKARGRYFFGGRVNYKAGGRIGFAGGGKDAGKDSDFGNENYGGNDSPRGPAELGLTTRTPPTPPSGNDEPKNKFFNDPKTLYQYTNFGYNIPTGLTTKTPFGRLSAIMNLNKTIEDEDLEGKVQLDRYVGPIDTRTAYDTTIGPTFDASYTRGPVNIGYNNLDGINASYNKGNVSIGYNNGQATFGYNKSFAKGGRVSFKNGGLASIL